MSLDQLHEQPGRRRRKLRDTGTDLTAAESSVQVQTVASTMDERDRLLEQRERELWLLRQEHIRLAGRLWNLENELVTTREEHSRKADILPQEIDSTLLAPSPPETIRNRSICPYLSSYSNRAERYDQPSNRHVCYAIGHALWSYGPADREVQKDVCLRKSVYPRCPRYQGARHNEVGDQSSANGKKPWWHFWR